MHNWNNIKEEEAVTTYKYELLTAYSVKSGISLEKLCLNCKNKLKVYYYYLIKTNTMSEYRLKPMYNGLALKPGSNVIINQASMTDMLAERFIKEHPKGEDLFDYIPKKEVEDKPKRGRKKKVDESNNVTE